MRILENWYLAIRSHRNLASFTPRIQESAANQDEPLVFESRVWRSAYKKRPGLIENGIRLRVERLRQTSLPPGACRNYWAKPNVLHYWVWIYGYGQKYINLVIYSLYLSRYISVIQTSWDSESEFRISGIEIGIRVWNYGEKYKNP